MNIIKLLSLCIYTFILYTELCLSTLYIRSPKSLSKKFPNGKIESSISKFGNIPYGYNIVGKVIYDKEVLANKFGKVKESDKLTSEFCSIDDISKDEIIDVLNEELYVDEVPILLADRGECSFVSKVLNMEKLGAHVAIIADKSDYDIINTVMPDNGKGMEVSIPSELISKKDADIIKEYMYNNPQTDVILEIDFEIEQKSVSYITLYTSSNIERVYKLFTDFEEMYNDLSITGSVIFTPHYITYEHPLYGERDSLNEEERKQVFSNCYSNGKYCVPPNNNAYATNSDNVSFTNTDIIEENLRQKCVFNLIEEDITLNTIKNNINQTNETNSIINNRYYKYMTYFYKNCYLKNKFNKDCSYDIIQKIGIDKQTIDNCVEDSFDSKESSSNTLRIEKDNKILDKDNSKGEEYYIKYLPSLLINERLFFGNWTAANLFEGICSSILDRPGICNNRGTFIRRKSIHEDYSALSTIAFIVGICLTITVIIFLLCRYRIKKNISDNLESSNIGHKISTVVTSYMSLKDTSSGR